MDLKDGMFIATSVAASGKMSGTNMRIHDNYASAVEDAQKRLSSDHMMKEVIVFMAVAKVVRQESPVQVVSLIESSPVTPSSNGAGDPFVQGTGHSTDTASFEWEELSVFKAIPAEDVVSPDNFSQIGLSDQDTYKLYVQGCFYWHQIANLSIAALHVLLNDAGIMGPLANYVREQCREKVLAQLATT